MIETVLNVGTGYIIAIFTQALIFPFFGIHIPLSQNVVLAALFTIISIIRGYFFRRLFNMISEKKRNERKT